MAEIEKTYGCGNYCRTNISGIVRCMNKYRQEIWHSMLLMIIYLTSASQRIPKRSEYQLFFGNFLQVVILQGVSTQQSNQESQVILTLSPACGWNLLNLRGTLNGRDGAILFSCTELLRIMIIILIRFNSVNKADFPMPWKLLNFP